MFKVEIETGNAAFHDPYGCDEPDTDDRFYTVAEIQRILRKIIEQLDEGQHERTIIDYYGNSVGSWKLEI